MVAWSGSPSRCRCHLTIKGKNWKLYNRSEHDIFGSGAIVAISYRNSQWKKPSEETCVWVCVVCVQLAVYPVTGQ